MQSFIFGFFRIFKSFRLWILSFRGISEKDLQHKNIVTGKAWEEFCDNLKTAGTALVFPGAPRDVFQQAEGIRYLTRLTRAGLEAFVEYNDPEFPVFRRMVHETVKMGADNPDNYYMNAQITGEHEYIIKGKRNSIFYVGFFTQNGNYGTTGGLAPCGVLEDKDLVVEEDGSFEIILSKEKKSKNWLKIEDETSLVMVRQTYFNRKKESHAEIIIENLSGKKFPDPLKPERLEEGLKTASLFVAGAPMLFARWAKGFQKHTNELPIFDPKISNAAGGDANIIYHHSHWKLAEGEALQIEVKPPPCDHWNFQLNNYWMESLDYRYFDICINKATAKYDKDGTVKIVVAHSDPGVSNWLQTCGHNEGTMCWRWYRIQKGASPVVPQTRVIKLPNK